MSYRSVWRLLASAVVVAVAGCGAKQPTALEACRKLEVAGVATSCKASQPEGLGAAASERAVFDLPSVPGRTGQVLSFEKDKSYETTVDAFTSAALLAGPHRYGSAKTRIFVQMNDAASAEVGARARSVVDALPGDSAGPPVSTTPPPEAKAAPPSASAATTAPAGGALITATDACQKLASAGVAKNCGKSADDKVIFEIVGMPGKTGTVVHVADEKAFSKYAALVDGTPPTSALRPFSASPKAHVVVHLTKGVAPALEAKTKTVVDAL